MTPERHAQLLDNVDQFLRAAMTALQLARGESENTTTSSCEAGGRPAGEATSAAPRDAADEDATTDECRTATDEVRRIVTDVRLGRIACDTAISRIASLYALPPLTKVVTVSTPTLEEPKTKVVRYSCSRIAEVGDHVEYVAKNLRGAKPLTVLRVDRDDASVLVCRGRDQIPWWALAGALQYVPMFVPGPPPTKREPSDTRPRYARSGELVQVGDEITGVPIGLKDPITSTITSIEAFDGSPFLRTSHGPIAAGMLCWERPNHDGGAASTQSLQGQGRCEPAANAGELGKDEQGAEKLAAGSGKRGKGQLTSGSRDEPLREPVKRGRSAPKPTESSAKARKSTGKRSGSQPKARKTQAKRRRPRRHRG